METQRAPDKSIQPAHVTLTARLKFQIGSRGDFFKINKMSVLTIQQALGDFIKCKLEFRVNISLFFTLMIGQV